MGSILLMGAGLQTTVTGPTYDPDAQLFFNAQTGAGVTLTTTQMNAVNQWVVDSKAANIWTKFKAIYPVVGGTATSHKFNLKNPLDTNAAYRLVFSGGWTHTSTGMLPNGTNAYADTFLTPNAIINNNHLSYYIRTDVNLTQVDIGTTNGANNLDIESRIANICYSNSSNGALLSYANTSSLGFYINSRLSASSFKAYKNELLKATSATGTTSSMPFNIYLGARNGVPLYYSSKQCAFSTIGDGLTDLESQLFYQITEKYQVALSRNINTTQSFYYNSAYNNETNAFLFSTQITDNTIQTATNTLVTDLKTAGVFTKMKALYPMVGGTATTHKFNLVNSQDTDAAFRLAFVGGWTHSANGALPNGTNAYANTFLTPSTILTNNNTHLSYYSRTILQGNNLGLIGCSKNATSLPLFTIYGRSLTNNVIMDSYDYTTCRNFITDSTGTAFYINSRTTSTSFKSYRNAVMALSNAATNTYNVTTINFPITIGALNLNGAVSQFSNFQCAFTSIGDGLTDAEALAFYNAVQLFNTTLARQV